MTVSVWRIAVEAPAYSADDMSGAGAKLSGGRWNSRASGLHRDRGTSPEKMDLRPEILLTPTVSALARVVRYAPAATNDLRPAHQPPLAPQ